MISDDIFMECEEVAYYFSTQGCNRLFSCGAFDLEDEDAAAAAAA
jgi:hypothetical protein